MERTFQLQHLKSEKKKYTKKEIYAADGARELEKKLEYLGRASILKMLHYIAILRAEDIYGKAISEIKGKTTRYKSA